MKSRERKRVERMRVKMKETEKKSNKKETKKDMVYEGKVQNLPIRLLQVLLFVLRISNVGVNKTYLPKSNIRIASQIEVKTPCF